MPRAVFVAMLVAGCASGGTPSSPPADTLEAYARAARDDDPRAAYDLLSAETRRALPYEAFYERWKRTAGERKRQSTSLGAATRDGRVVENAVVMLDETRETALVRDADGWRMEAPLISATRAATPQDAVRMLATAVENRSFEGIVAILADRNRDEIQLLLDEFVKCLEGVAGEVDVVNDRAAVTCKTGRYKWKVKLVREKGGWKVEDIQPLR